MRQLTSAAPGVFDFEVDERLAAEFLSDSRHHIVVSVDRGRIVGFVSAMHYVHPDKPAEMWINEVAVAPDYQKRGLGRRMLDMTLKLASDLGCANAWVLTDDANVAATRLYRSAGGRAEEAVLFEFSLRRDENAT